jgi:hypothetical protein
VSAQIVGKRPKTKKEKNQRLLWLTEAQAALGWAVLLALAAVLGAIYLHQASGIARVGRTVQGIQFQLNEIKRENAKLELDIAERQSLHRLRAEAIRLGFIPATPDDIEYLVIDGYPSGQDTSDGSETDFKPVEIDTAAEAIWRSLTSRISDLVRGEVS